VGDKKSSRVNKAMAGHYAAANVTAGRVFVSLGSKMAKALIYLPVPNYRWIFLLRVRLSMCKGEVSVRVLQWNKETSF